MEPGVYRGARILLEDHKVARKDGQLERCPSQEALLRSRISGVLRVSRKELLTVQTFPGWVHIRQVIAWTTTNHQIKWAPLFNLKGKNRVRAEMR